LRRIPTEARIKLYEQWRSIDASFPPPEEAPALPVGEQAALQRNLPINFDPLREVLQLLNIHKWMFSVPTAPREFIENYGNSGMREYRKTVFEGITRLLARGTDQEKTQLLDRLALMTAYLSEEDPLRKRERADVAFVPGARTHLRAEKAGELFNAGRVTQIYLTGHSPYYSKNEDKPQPLTECLAMAVYLVDKRPDLKVGWGNLMLETRAHCTIENVLLSKRPLLSAALQRPRPLTIVIVTSTYHMRRAYLMMQALVRKHHNAIGTLRRVAADTRPELGKEVWFRNQRGIDTWLGEYWKIHGGRVTGEF
jgi:hypothetical protein